ncbi:MAG: DUF6489 family protein [Thiohalocapsa sp.]|jgi:hypothetical protein|nr:DUF6489 family protein [Thiohalocapsa sp.]
MNIKIDIDITPDEMRKLMGLPDVDAFQRQLMEDIRERINQGVEGYDPLKLFQPYLSSSLAGMEMMQRLMTAGLGGSESKKDNQRD